ncbi:B-box zinc finger [Paragonimus heterotremus]|uniref:B-box zinc finger n=1 Tax=Paragonimus heterotremus TaxID=100268 RepID=A0A8J4THU8_9TREM|nr:B-box zinc finger [Paragonimus heterotremus]
MAEVVACEVVVLPDAKNEKDSEVQLLCCVCSSLDACDILSNCLHLVCRKCAASLKLEDSYLCPTCSERSKKLINNPIFARNDSILKSPSCNWCEDNGEQTKSIGNCKECDVWLCGECLKGHNRMPPLRSHSITMLPKTGNQDGLRCETHPHEALECFCEACGILTCRDCQLSVHRDHGSHRWVGEKANILTSSLEESMKRLEQCQNKLAGSCQIALAASTSTKDDSFLGSVEKTRLAIEARASSLILRIRSRTDALIKELNAKCTESVKQLTASESLMRELEARTEFTLAFASRLIKNKDSDPASLVQLFDAVQARIDLICSRAERLISDASPSADALETKDEHSDDPCAWRKATLGWRATANTRALFIAHWDPEELIRHSGTIAWLPVHHTFENSTEVNGKKTETSNHIDVLTDKGDMKSNIQLKTELEKISNEEYGEFLDSLAALDGRQRNSDSLTDQPVAGGVGCAICFGAGLLAHCGKCRRAYHLDCHLPRLTNISLVPGWVCGLCADKDAATAAHVAQSDGTGLSHLDYLAGCRILMGLLVHAEAVHFTASVCPACSVPLLTPGRSVPHCPAGHLYHRLAELRLQLEEAATTENGLSHRMDDLEDHDVVGGTGPPSGGRIRLTRLDDWLVEVDKFWSDASNEDNQIRGVTAGCLRAARRLRARLASLVKVHRPQSQASFLSLCADDSPDNCVQTDVDVASVRTDPMELSANASIFKIGTD